MNANKLERNKTIMVNCDFCKEIIENPIVSRCITFCEPMLVLHFCSNECSIRWEADAFTKGLKKKKYLEEFLPKAIVEDKALGVAPYASLREQK
jgi:hypothetical protein